jgi:hypothetical protein
MDTSGNTVVKNVSLIIIDEIPPQVIMTVNGPRNNPARFAVLGNNLQIVSVALDNAKISDVLVSINNGTFFSIFNNTTNVTVTGGGESGITRGTYKGYFYGWTPSFEGTQLVAVKGIDSSGLETVVAWQITVVSTQTILYTVVIIVVVIIIFGGIAAYIAKKRRSKDIIVID